MAGARILLSVTDIQIAIAVGTRRRLANMVRGNTEPRRPNDAGNRWDNEIEGAAGELATAKALDLFWDGNFDNPKAPDVGPFDVRTSPHANACLVLHEDDNMHRIHLLVAGGFPSSAALAGCSAKTA